MNEMEYNEQERMNVEDNYTYLLREIELGYLEVCHNCGNVWDGHAQCNCWQWDNFDEEISENSDYDPIIYGFEPTSVCDIVKLDRQL